MSKKIQTKFEKQFEAKFGFDVSTLPEYVNEQSTTFFTDIVETSTFMSTGFTLMENVKHKEKIKLLSADMDLQTMSGCTPSPSGTVTFTDRTIETVRLYMGMEFCNEELVQKYTQMLLEVGASRQDEDIVLQDVLLAYLLKVVQRKAQRLAMLGDTDSVVPDLVHLDGMVKLLTNDPDIIVAQSDQSEIDASNGYDILKTVYDAIPTAVKQDGLDYLIVCGYETARACIDQVWSDKDYSANFEHSEDKNGVITFTLPTTNVRVMSVVELNGTDNVFSWIASYAFLGTDAESDTEDLEVLYFPYERKLKIETIFREGVQFILPQYWVKLRLLPS
ncbi:MAG: hypothetical protein GQ553_03100 [Nitrosomonadaceae bacterium]|nr:hypothetical protein [Nitrosomonadaceae bacterium]